MKNYKEEFERIYGEGSFNDDFLINANSANNIHRNCLTDDFENQDGFKIKIFQMARHYGLSGFMKLMDTNGYKIVKV